MKAVITYIIGSIFSIILLLAAAAVTATDAKSATFDVIWTAPDARIDGTPLLKEEISHYIVYLTSPNGNYDNVYIATAAEAYSIADHDFPPGEYCVAVSTVLIATDGEGLTSEKSKPACFTLKANPKVPTDVIIRIIAKPRTAE